MNLRLITLLLFVYSSACAQQVPTLAELSLRQQELSTRFINTYNEFDKNRKSLKLEIDKIDKQIANIYYNTTVASLSFNVTSMTVASFVGITNLTKFKPTIGPICLTIPIYICLGYIMLENFKKERHLHDIYSQKNNYLNENYKNYKSELEDIKVLSRHLLDQQIIARQEEILAERLITRAAIHPKLSSQHHVPAKRAA